MKTLVINHSIEQTALIEDHNEAVQFMVQPPTNVKFCYALQQRPGWGFNVRGGYEVAFFISFHAAKIRERGARERKIGRESRSSLNTNYVSTRQGMGGLTPVRPADGAPKMTTNVESRVR